MYNIRSDAIIRVPYGDTLLFEVDIDEIDLEEEYEVYAEIRNQLGELLTELEQVGYVPLRLRSRDLIPIGLHYMDIRFQTTKGDSFHSEPFGVEVINSVTKSIFDDPSGRYVYKN